MPPAAPATPLPASSSFRPVVTAIRRRRRPRPLEQIPVWTEPAGAACGRVRTPRPRPAWTPCSTVSTGEQLRAVTHGEGPLLVVAGAGTGKTQVVTRRIAWLIATRRARPSEILALTFTDKAAAEMQVRVDQLVPYGYTDTAIATFHAFGDRLIREYALELGLPPDVRVLSRPEVVIFLRERLFELDLDHYRPLGDPDPLPGRAGRPLQPAQGRGRRPGDLPRPRRAGGRAGRAAGRAGDRDRRLGRGPRVGCGGVEEAARQLELARAYARYQALLGEAGFIDFGDQVALALRLLRESPAARREVQRRFRYVLVDEFQDTNRAQAELVELIAEPHRNVTVVGDDDQSIYRFRGAATEQHRRVPGSLPRRPDGRPPAELPVAGGDPRRPATGSSGSTTRTGSRSRPGSTSDSAPQRPEPPAGRRVPAVRHEAFATGAEEADWIAREIAGRVAARRRAAGPRHPRPVQRRGGRRSCAASTWPASRGGSRASSGLYARPEVRLLLAFLRAVADLGLERRRLRPGRLGRLRPGRRGPDRRSWPAPGGATGRSGRCSRSSTGSRASCGSRRTPGPRSSAWSADLRRYAGLAHERPAGEVLYAFLKESGLLARLAAADERAARRRRSRTSPGSSTSSAPQSALLADDRCRRSWSAICRPSSRPGDDPPTAELDDDRDAVAVLTVHKAKGLEFPIVFLVGLVDGRFPAADRRDPLAIPGRAARGRRRPRATPTCARSAGCSTWR